MIMLNRNVGVRRLLDVLNTTSENGLINSKLNVIENDNTSIITFTTSILVYKIECEKDDFKKYWVYIIQCIIKLLNVYRYKKIPDLNKRSKMIESIIKNVLEKCEYDPTGNIKKDEIDTDNNYFILNNMEIYLKSVSDYIDVDICSTIILLNLNNYKTLYSCSSHLYNNNWYIMFEYSEKTSNMLYDMYESLKEIKNSNIAIRLNTWKGKRRIALYVYKNSDVVSSSDIIDTNIIMFDKFSAYIGSKG